jgi:lysophospholipase L1-like esterase
MLGRYLAIRLPFLYSAILKMRKVRPRIRHLAMLIAVASVLWASNAPPASAAAGVLLVGDSLEVGTSPYLRGLLRGIPLTVDAQTSRPSSTGVEILRLRLQSSDQVVVFDLGTNDDPAQPQALAADLAAVRSIVGGRCVVVATLNRPPYNGVSIDGLNGAIRDFAVGSPPTQLVDWRAAALSTPGLLGPDGVHATAAGYSTRAQLIAQGILGCFSGSASVPPASGAPEGESPLGARAAPSPPRQPKVDWAKLGLPNPAVLLAALELEGQRLAAAVRQAVSAPLAVLRSF